MTGPQARAQRNQQAAASAGARGFLAAVAALDAWVVEHMPLLLGNPAPVIEAMPIERVLRETLLAAWVPLMTAAAARAPAIKRLDDLTRAAGDIALQQGSTLVVEISATTRTALRQIISRGIVRNWTIPRVAKAVQDTVGLHSRYATAVSNRRDALISKGLTEKRVDTQVATYRKKLLRSRANTIARTETAFAESKARYEGWQAEMSSGALDADLQRVWLVGDPCAICAALSAHPPVPMGQPFTTTDGRSLYYPPAHPNCKCTMGLVRVDARAPGGSTQLVGSASAS